LAPAVIAFPTPLQAVTPLGSFIYQGTQTATLASSGDTDSFTLAVNVPQTVTVVVRPAGALVPTVELTRDGTTVQSATAGGPGQAVVFQTVPTPVGPGGLSEARMYAVNVGSASGTGSFTVQIILDAAVESASYGGPSDSTPATAQDMDPAFLEGRSAVVGSVNHDQHWFRFTLNAGENSTLALNGAAHLNLVDSAGNVLATGRTGTGNLGEVISDFIAPATDTYYVMVTGTAAGATSLLVTRNGDFDTEPNFTQDTAQEILSAPAGLTQYVFGSVGAMGVSGGSAHVLYFDDVAPSGTDPYMTAFASLGITPTVVPQATISDPTMAYSAFVTDLQAGGWDLVVFQQRYWSSGDFPSFSWISPFVNYINGGGHVIYSTWIRTQVFTDPAVASLFTALGATTTGNANQTSVSQTVASPIWDSVPNPLSLGLDSGLGVSSNGLHAGAGQAIGRFGNGDDALVVGNNNHTILSGFMPYLATTAGAASQLIQNELSFLLARSDPADFYKVTLAPGASIQLKVELPANSSGALPSVLQPELRLYDPAGNLLDSTGPGVQLSYTVPADGGGSYVIEVLPAPGSGTQGEYRLAVDTEQAQLPAFRVTATTPADGSHIPPGAGLSAITVHFNHNVDLTSLDASDLTLDGLSATGYTVASGNTVTFYLFSGLSAGTHVVHLGGGSIHDVAGSSLEDFTATFTLDS
jgi:hypothetical protein